MGKALDAGRRSGQQNGAMTPGRHTPRRLLGDEKSAEGGDRQGLLHGKRVELGKGAAGAGRARQRIKFSRVAGCQGDFYAKSGEAMRQRRANGVG
jgi:hypothetical protein